MSPNQEAWPWQDSKERGRQAVKMGVLEGRENERPEPLRKQEDDK